MPSALIFTDLDGTLLDHETYDWSPAAPLLARLTQAGIPVILASSKTAAEMVPLREQMGLQDCPLICENGAGVVPAGPSQGVSDNCHYAKLRRILDEMPRVLRQNFEGFGDMGTVRIAEITGLAPEAAANAAQRAFSEPGLWSGSEEEKIAFQADLARHDVAARSGGRFLTLSFGGTKADRMADIAEQFGHPTTIALGDAPNDAEMLQAADHGIIVANPHGTGLPTLPGETEGRIRRSDIAGPAGWSAALSGLLSDLGIAF